MEKRNVMIIEAREMCMKAMCCQGMCCSMHCCYG